MKRFLLALSLSVMMASAFALSSVEDVQSEVAKGNYAHAEQMMSEVVSAKPNSARAHYIYAEILAHNGRFDRAEEQATLARQIDPELKFTKPEEYTAFRQLLEREQKAGKSGSTVAPANRATATGAATTQQSFGSGGIPSWAWLVGLAVIAFGLIRLMSARRNAQASAAAGFGSAGAGAPGFGPGGAGTGQPYGNNPSAYGQPGAPGYGPGVAAQGARGGGLLGTGLAVAGGMAAGALAERYLDGRRDNDQLASGGPFSDLSGSNSDAGAAARELEQRSVDFGSGNDWGGDVGGNNDSDDGRLVGRDLAGARTRSRRRLRGTSHELRCDNSPQPDSRSSTISLSATASASMRP